MEWIIVFFVGWILGSMFTKMWMALSFRDILKDLGVTEQQLRNLAAKNNIPLRSEHPEPELREIDIVVEQHNDCLFAYRSEDRQFMAQGRTEQELLDHLKSRFKDVRLRVQSGSELLVNR